MKIDNYKNYIFSFVLIVFFLINIYQLNSQHWSGVMDQDSMIIYNSLLKINTIGSIPVLKLYQKACIPVLIGSALEIAAAA